MTWFGRYLRYLTTWREHRNTIKHLNRMTNQQLKDIGLNRGDIDRMVWLKEDKTMRGRGK